VHIQSLRKHIYGVKLSLFFECIAQNVNSGLSSTVSVMVTFLLLTCISMAQKLFQYRRVFHHVQLVIRIYFHMVRQLYIFLLHLLPLHVQLWHFVHVALELLLGIIHDEFVRVLR